MLPDKVPKEHLINTSPIDNCSIPESAAQFDCLEQNRLGFFEAHVRAHAMAETHSTKTRGWDLQVLELERLDHFDDFGLGETCLAEVVFRKVRRENYSKM